MISCPPREHLERLLAESLAEQEREALEPHVDSCPTCQEFLTNLLDQLPLQRRHGCASLDPFLQRLCRIPPVGEVPIRFPGPPTQRGPLGQLQGFHLIEQLGRGATGSVFKAYDPELDRLVAIKVLRPELATSATGRTRFLREARAAAAVRHEHVVAIYQVGYVPDFALPYLVMEYVEGESLGSRLNRLGPLEPREAARIVREAALGLAYAHERGLVHRDVTPGNILLEERTGRAKIGDFGLACAAEAPESKTTGGAGAGHLVGTPAYMSPEQLARPDRVGVASDVYSLGVVLYEALVGEPPFRGPLPRILHQVKHQDPLPPRLCRPEVPVGLETITITCLAKEPALRYGTAEELATDLEHWLAGEAIPPRRPSPLVRLRSWCGRHPAIAAAWASASLALLVLAGLTVHLAGTQRDTARALRVQQEELAAGQREHQQFQAEAALDRGVALCQRGEAGRGMLWFAHALQQLPEYAADLKTAARTHIRAWERQLHPLQILFPHEETVHALAIHPEGRVLLTATSGHVVRLWEADGGRLIGELPHLGSALSLTFAPDGRMVLTQHPEGEVRLSAIEPSSKVMRLMEPGQAPVGAAAFTPDGKHVLTIGRDGKARLWDVTDGRLPDSPFTLPAEVTRLAFSPDGRHLLTAGERGRVRLWAADTGEPLPSPDGHRADATTIVFSPDGRTVLSASKDHSARLWDPVSGREVGVPLLHRDKVYAAAFSPDGRMVLTASKDGTARLWNTATGQPLGPACHHSGPVFAAAFHPNGQSFVTGCGDGAARLWTIHKYEPVEIRPGHEGLIRSGLFLTDGQSFLTGGADGAVRRCEPTTGASTALPIRETGYIEGLTLLSGGRVLLTVMDGGLCRRWDLERGELTGVPFVHAGGVRAVTASRDGRLLCTGSENRNAQVWDAETSQPLGPSLPHRGAVTAVAFHPEGRRLLSGCWDGTAQLWDVTTSQPLGEPFKHRSAVTGVAFDPHGRLALTVSRDATGQFWDLATRRAVGQPLEHDQPILAVAISPDGRIAATGSEDRTVRLWEVGTGRSLGPPLPHAEFVQVVAFHPDGRTLLAVGARETARIWSVPCAVEGSPQQVRASVERMTGLALDDNGRLLALPPAALLAGDRKAWRR